MKLRRLRIHNFRSIIDAEIEVHDYTMILGANKAGKSNVLAALRTFYDDIKWSADDAPKVGRSSDETWIELAFVLTDTEWNNLADKYKEDTTDQTLTVRRYFASKSRVKSNQSNIYGLIKGQPENSLFYGAKNIGAAKVGRIIYIPARRRSSVGPASGRRVDKRSAVHQRRRGIRWTSLSLVHPTGPTDDQGPRR